MADHAPRAACSPVPLRVGRGQLPPTGDAIAALDWLFEREFLGPHAIAAVVGINHGDDSLALLGAAGDLPAFPRRQPLTLPLDADMPLCRAARLGVCASMMTRASIVHRSPWLAAVAPAAQSAITVPIRAGGRPIGAIGVTYACELPFGAGDVLARLADIGESLGASLRTAIAQVR